ncbi:unnamed protein product [Caretta caretta]
MADWLPGGLYRQFFLVGCIRVLFLGSSGWSVKPGIKGNVQNSVVFMSGVVRN